MEAGPEASLLARRERAWVRLGDEERVRARRILQTAGPRRDLPPFASARTAYEKVLHALVSAGEPVSPPEIAYLLIAWWGFNTDIASVRRRLALAVQQGEVRSSGTDRYYSTSLAVEHLHNAERKWGSRDLRDRRPPRQPGRRHDAAR